MNSIKKSIFAIGYLAASVFLLSCTTAEDPGPLQEGEKSFSVLDFDRLEMGSAFIIDVTQGNSFSIKAKGDIRNLDDLKVYKEGSTLMIHFRNYSSNHRHETHISITMPELRSATFSGASSSTVSGFSGNERFNFHLSGGSVSQVDIESTETELTLSGASILSLRGAGTTLKAEVSGASNLNAFNFPVSEATVHASGASRIKVSASDKLTATASGASQIVYRGNPALTKSTSGASSIESD